MKYTLKIIQTIQEIETCCPFAIDQYNWGGLYRPKAYGYAGIISQEGIAVKMICEEAEPLCTCYTPNSLVYFDSALEAFFQFSPKDDPCYFNFEMNSAGALLAQFGDNRYNRTYFTEKQIAQCDVQKGKLENAWWIQLFIPFSLLKEFHKNLSLIRGSSIKCNFYKISETKSIEHFASFAPIPYPEPNFHFIEYFADAIIE